MNDWGPPKPNYFNSSPNRPPGHKPDVPRRSTTLGLPSQNTNYENHRLNPQEPNLSRVEPPIAPKTERSKIARVKSLSKSPSKCNTRPDFIK